MSYVLSRKYGYREKDYLKPGNFMHDSSKQKQINDLIKKMKRQIRINGSQHSATSHYIENYGYVPLWITVKVLSFGIMSELFSILKREDKNEIADHYKIGVEDLEVYFALLSNYRNLCAHEDLLFNHFTQKVVPDNTIHNKLNIEKINDEYVSGKNDIFGLIIILKQMLTKDEFKLLMSEVTYELNYLEAKLKTIKIDAVLKNMGFPENYKDIIYL